MSKTRPIVAAFDFDKTLTNWESNLQFLIYTHGRVKTYTKLLALIPSFTLHLLGKIDNGETKERVFQQFFDGCTQQNFFKMGEDFAREKIPYLLNLKALERLLWHQNQKHRCILVSASVDAYLKPWAESAGFDDILCSALEFDSNGIFTGKLKGRNCRGPEKARLLNELLGPKEGYTLYAYGDSDGDTEMLEMADYPTTGTSQRKETDKSEKE